MTFRHDQFAGCTIGAFLACIYTKDESVLPFLLFNRLFEQEKKAAFSGETSIKTKMLDGLLLLFYSFLKIFITFIVTFSVLCKLVQITKKRFVFVFLFFVFCFIFLEG